MHGEESWGRVGGKCDQVTLNDILKKFYTYIHMLRLCMCIYTYILCISEFIL